MLARSIRSSRLIGKREWQLWLLVLPAVVFFLVFHYAPMYGLVIAFKRYSVSKGIWESPWVGLMHFKRFFNSAQCWELIVNTLILSFYQLLVAFPPPLILAFMLNHTRAKWMKKSVQTITYAPHFISLVVMTGMLTLFGSPSSGIINILIKRLGGQPIYFMAEPGWFRHVFVFSHVWQHTGYSDYRYKNSMASTEIQDRFAIMPALTGPHGDKGWLRAVAGMNEGAFALTRACKNPELAIRWLDYVNEPENNIQMLYGMFKPAGWTASEALVPSETEEGKWTDNTALRPADVQPNDWPWSAPIGSSPVISTKEIINQYIATRANNVYKEETCAVYRDDLTKYPYNFPYRFTLDEIEELNLIQLDLTNYVFRTEAAWISEGGVEEQWDSYLAQLKRLGMDRYVELYQTAFDRQK